MSQKKHKSTPRVRKKIPTDIRHLVLHEAGYRCGNPACRMPLTLEIHHLDPISVGGGDKPDNLLCLCPNCHTMHHNGIIPIESLKTWKLVLLSLNEGFDRGSVDIILAIHMLGDLTVTGDGMLRCAPLFASGLVEIKTLVKGTASLTGCGDIIKLALSSKGLKFVDGWKSGNQAEALGNI